MLQIYWCAEPPWWIYYDIRQWELSLHQSWSYFEAQIGKVVAINMRIHAWMPTEGTERNGGKIINGRNWYYHIFSQVAVVPEANLWSSTYDHCFRTILERKLVVMISERRNPASSFKLPSLRFSMSFTKSCELQMS